MQRTATTTAALHTTKMLACHVPAGYALQLLSVHLCVSQPLLQGKTALADTPGSIFLAECTRLAGELAYDELIKKLASQLDVVFAQSSEKGAPHAMLARGVCLCPKLQYISEGWGACWCRR
jgi:hypothetical protein